MSSDQAALVVLVATGSRSEAAQIARTTVERKLAACVQLYPIFSCYEWEGQVVEAEEYLLLLKTRHAAYADLEACVRELHSYDVPEIIALPVVAGATDYLNWLHDVLNTRQQA
ncbi:MAG: divalent-cation tolerance protein CutA [Chloroflexaceae bacterium]|nr:divalent-cation tolerance protein CutA [Chloroflexaceae bacterium]NJO05214.1 divalent-cation tolerance protein CutA [Chloroflexaceae bacterium]